MTPHIKGLLITGGGVLILTPDALLIHLADMPALDQVFWRGSLNALVITVACFAVWRSQILSRFRAVGWHGAIMAVLYGFSSICFVTAMTMTSAANVLIVVASSPLLAGLVSIVMLRETVPLSTWIATIVAMIGIGVVAAEQIQLNAGMGEFYALICAMAMAVKFNIVRLNKHVNMIPATAMGGVVMALGGLILSDTAGLIPIPPTSTSLTALLITGLFIIPVSFGAITLGPRYLPAPEVALLLLLETVLGPVWVWLIVNEAPSTHGLIGGVIVVGTLAVHALWSYRKDLRPLRTRA